MGAYFLREGVCAWSKDERKREHLLLHNRQDWECEVCIKFIRSSCSELFIFGGEMKINKKGINEGNKNNS